MFEAASYNNCQNILITSFQCPNLLRAITQINKISFLFKFSPGYLLIIFYQLTKFEDTCCNSFLDIFVMTMMMMMMMMVMMMMMMIVMVVVVMMMRRRKRSYL